MAFAQASTKKRKSSNNYGILQPNVSQSSDPLAARQPRKGKRTNPLASLFFFMVGIALFRTLIWTIHLASDWSEGFSNNKYYYDSEKGGDDKIALVTNAGAADTTKQYNNNINYTDFSYDLNAWHTPPRIVILAGPHKAASTTLQKFVSKLAGATTSLMRDHPGYDDSLFPQQPHESFRNSWIWPLPVPPEMAQITNGPYGKDSYGIAFANSSSKFYTSLAAFATQRAAALPSMYTGWKNVQGNPIEEQDYHKRVSQIYKRLFLSAWTAKPHNRGIVFGSELFDAVIDGIYDTTNSVPGATSRINRLLEVLPLGIHRSTGMPLQETDIEIHIHYRTPRVDHLVSWWHELSQTKNRTFRELMVREGTFRLHGHITNSLALALQFVRRGLKTTIVDMEGVRQMDNKFPPIKHTKSHVHIAGLQGVLVCEILRMSELCTTDDEKRRNYLALPFEGTTRKERQGLTQAANQREDTSIKNLTSTQLEAMEYAYQHYDCGVWRHLQPFLQKGLLRILHPSENLFATCEQQHHEMTFRDLWLELSAIAAQ